MFGCPACQKTFPPEITKRASPLSHLHPHQVLPIRVTPLFGQTIASYLDQLAAANHLPAATLLAHLPSWFRTQYRTHDDLAGHTRVTLGDADDLTRLTGNNPNALLRALPVAGSTRPRPSLRPPVHRLPPLRGPARLHRRRAGAPARAAASVPARPHLAR